jgi:hypothetical protein
MYTWPNRDASGGPCGGQEDRKTEQPKQSDQARPVGLKPTGLRESRCGSGRQLCWPIMHQERTCSATWSVTCSRRPTGTAPETVRILPTSRRACCRRTGTWIRRRCRKASSRTGSGSLCSPQHNRHESHREGRSRVHPSKARPVPQPHRARGGTPADLSRQLCIPRQSCFPGHAGRQRGASPASPSDRRHRRQRAQARGSRVVLDQAG